MIESLKVASILELKGTFQEQLKAYRDSLTKINEQLKTTQKEINQFAKTIEKISIRDPFRKMNESLMAMRGNLQAVVTQMGQLRALSGFTGGSINMGNGVGDETYDRRTPHQTDQFLYRKEHDKERDRLREENRGKSLRHKLIHGHLRESMGIAGMRFGGGLSWPVMAVAGAAYIGYQGESEWQRALMRIKAQGFSPDEVESAVKFAKTSKIHGIDPTSLLRAVKDAGMATKSMSMSLKMAPALATIEYENRIQFGSQYSAAQAAALAKFAEIRGGGNLAPTLRALNLEEKMINVSGGNLMPIQMFTNLVAGSLAMQHISDKGMFELEPIIQELNRAGLGTGLQSGSLQLFGSHLTKAAKASLVKEGLGHMSGKNFILGKSWAKTLQTNPVQFARDYHNLLKNKFHMTDEQISQQEQFDFTRTFAKFVGLVNKNWAKIKRTLGLYDSVPGIEGTAANEQGTEPAQLQNMINAYRSMALAFGELVAPAEMAGIKTLTSILNDLAKVFTLFAQPAVKLGFGDLIKTGFKDAAFMSTGLTVVPETLYHLMSQSTSDVSYSMPTGNVDKSLQLDFDPHDAIHPIMTMIGRHASRPLSGTSNINLYEDRLLPQLNTGLSL